MTLINYLHKGICHECHKIVGIRKGIICKTYSKTNPLKKWKIRHKKCYEIFINNLGA